MQWILCFQTVSGGIKYYTSDLDNPTYLPFSKFVDYATEFNLIDFSGFLAALDKFRTIYIDTEEGTWEIYKEDKETEVDFKDLYKLNNKEKQEEKTLIDKLNLDRHKQYIQDHSKIKSTIGIRQKENDNPTKR